MKKINKLLVISLAAISLAAPFLSSCDKKVDDLISEKEEVLPDSVTIDADKIELVVGDNHKINPRCFTDKNIIPELKFTSSDETIASVDSEGIITGNKPGNAVITVKYGDASTTCNVTVGLFDLIPSIKFDNIHSSSITVEKGSVIDLSAKVFFGGKYFDSNDIKLKVETSSGGSASSFGVKDGNKFTVNRTGTIYAVWSGKFFDYELEELRLEIKIVESVTIVLTKYGEDKEIKSIALFNYESYGDFHFLHDFKYDIKITERGQSRTPTSVELIDNENGAVALDTVNQTISAAGRKIGTAKLRITYKNNSQEYFTKDFPITVDYSFIPYQDEDIELFSLRDGTFDTEKIFGSFEASDRKLMVAKTTDGKNLEVSEDGKVSGIEDLGEQVQSIYLGNGLILKEVKFTSCTAIIRTAEDLEIFRITTDDILNNNSKVIENLKSTQLLGTYILANDIDAAGYALKPRGRITGDGCNAYKGCGFQGVFEGNGHTIYNLKTTQGGIFNNIGTGAVLRNFALKNLQNDAESGEDRYALASYINNAYIENVYIHRTKLLPSNANGFLAHEANVSTIIKNCMFVLDNPPNPININHGYGALFSICTYYQNVADAPKDFFKDSFVIANCPLVKAQNYSKDTACYYVDTKDITFDLRSNFESIAYQKFIMPNVTHYLTIQDMKNASGTFDTFNSYWKVINHELTWVGLDE